MRLPVVTLIVVYLIALAIDWYILCDLRYRGNGKPRRKMLPFRLHWHSAPWIQVYLTVLCLAFLTVTILLPRRDGSSLHPVMWMLYLFLTVYAGKLGYVIGSAIGRIPCIWRSRRRDTRRWLGISLAALCVFTLVWGALIGRRHIDVREVEIESPVLPSNFDGYRIVQFSDAHVDTWGNDTTFVAELVDGINALHPDMIVFTGDIVSRRTSEIYPFIKVFSRLKAPDGVYSILGNHDYGDYFNWSSEAEHQANTDELIHIEESMGWKMLNNSCDTIRRGDQYIIMAGVENWGEPPFKQYGELAKAVPDTPSNRNTFIVLLSHNPAHWHEIVRYNHDIDLTLSGHTHAMQCQFSLGGHRWSPSQWRYPEWSGLYSFGKPSEHLSQLYVNIGCGEVAMPSRIGTAFPEVTILTLRQSSTPKANRQQK